MSLDLVYFDIDGVLADERHRQHWILDGAFADYDAYFGDLALDSVWDEGRALYAQALATPGVEVSYLTGRRVDLYTITRRWLRTKGFGDHELVMKPFGRIGKLAEYKVEVIKNDLAVGWDSITLYDDDERVIKAVNDFALESGAPVEAILCGWHVKPRRMQFAAKA